MSCAIINWVQNLYILAGDVAIGWLKPVDMSLARGELFVFQSDTACLLFQVEHQEHHTARRIAARQMLL